MGVGEMRSLKSRSSILVLVGEKSWDMALLVSTFPRSKTPVNFSNSEGESPVIENDLLKSC